MNQYSDPSYLRGIQYKDAGNLTARIDLHSRFSTNRYGWQRWVFDHVRVPPDSCLLELGCGAGRMWVENRERIPRGWRMYLSDLSVGMLRDAQRTLAGVPQVRAWLVGDAQRVPLRGGRFDAVLANHMLYHVSDRARAVNEIDRLLAPGGLLIASTVGENHMMEIDEQLRAVGVGAEFLGRASSALFTLENGAPQLRAAFHEVTEHRYTDSLEVTDVDPLMAYIASMKCGPQLTAAALDRVRAHFGAEIERHGVALITKVSGLFVARQPVAR